MNQRASDQIAKKAIVSVKWDFLALVLPKAISPLTTVILARFLVPDDYGIIGIASLVVALAGTIRDFGVREAVIQQQESVPEAASSAFWLSLGSATVLAIGIFLSAPALAIYFGDIRVNPVLRVQCWQLILVSLGTVPAALLQREFEFKYLAAITVPPLFVPLLVAIPLAVTGFGYWALVLSGMVGAALRTGLLWYKVTWRPSLVLKAKQTREVAQFGGLVMLEGLAAWGISYGDKFVFGHYASTHALGVFVLGFNIVYLTLGLVASPLTSTVSYSALCRIKDIEKLGETYLRLTGFLSLVILPASIGLSLIAPVAVQLFFNESWKELASVLSILAFVGPFYLASINGNVYRAMGRPDIMPKIIFIGTLYIIPTYIISAQSGLIVFSWGRVSIDLVLWVPHFFIVPRLLGIRFFRYWHTIKAPLLATIGMALIVMGVQMLMDSTSQGIPFLFFRLLVSILSGCVSYVGLIWLFDASRLVAFLSIAKMALSKDGHT